LGNILILAGAAGLVAAAISAPIAVVLLRRQLEKLTALIQQESEQ